MRPIEQISALIPTIWADLNSLGDDGYCIIGSSALCLSGIELPVADLDVLTSAQGAKELMTRWSARRDHAFTPAQPERFRSTFGRFQFDIMPVEVMGGLEVNDGHAWTPVIRPETEIRLVSGLPVNIPTLKDQKRILFQLGRPKDLAKIRWIEKVENQINSSR